MTQQIIGGKFSATCPSSGSGYLSPAVGYKLHTYVSGTSTPLATYSDFALAVPNMNPVTLDTRGEASVFLGTGTYTLVLKSDTGTTIWTRDGIVASLSAADLLAPGGSALVGNDAETVKASFNALQLADYAALRAYAGSRKSVYVTGYSATAVPSGIAGMFIRDDFDAATADNGGTVIVATNGKRWKRQYSGPAFAHWFGADPLGIADSSTALAAVFLLPSVGLAAGTYLYSGILFPITGQKIESFGSVTLKKKNADMGAYTMIYMANKTDVTFVGELTIDGNGANQTASASSGKACIEVWNTSDNIKLSGVKIKNAYKWGFYLKGNSADGMPKNINLTDCTTEGSLGYLAGVAAADGETGLVIIAGDIKVVNCTFRDRIDLEANTALQVIDANFANCKFFKQFDSGVNGNAGSLTVTGSTFYATELTACARIYGGVFSGNLFTDKYQTVPMVTEWYGVIVLGNNNYATEIVGNSFQGPYIGVGFVAPNRALVSNNQIFVGATALGSTTVEAQVIPYGGITCGNTGAIRAFTAKNNEIILKDAFATAGGYGIESQSTDVRGIFVNANSVMNTSFATGKIYAAISRSFAASIGGNAATVTTNLTGTAAVESYMNGLFVTGGADRLAAPVGGTFAAGDVARITNGRSGAFVTEAYAFWYYTVDAGWKKSAAIIA
jgi:hypothetical protein